MTLTLEASLPSLTCATVENVVICWLLLTYFLRHIFSPFILGLFLYLFSWDFQSYFPLPSLPFIIPEDRDVEGERGLAVGIALFPQHLVQQTVFLFADFFLIFTASTCKTGFFLLFASFFLYCVIWNLKSKTHARIENKTSNYKERNKIKWNMKAFLSPEF